MIPMIFDIFLVKSMASYSRSILCIFPPQPRSSHLSKEPKIVYERGIKGKLCSQGTATFQLKAEGEETI